MRICISSISNPQSNPIPSSRSTRAPTCRAWPRADAGHTSRPRTLYGLLGLKSSATLADIRAAYRSAARRLHPDTNASPTAQEDFQHIKAAYEVLGDSRLRRLYDNLGFGALGPRYVELWSYFGGAAENAGRGSGRSSGAGAGGGSAGVRGRDVHLVLGIMLSEAAQGADKEVAYEALAACEDCRGTGYATAAPVCPVCGGSGQILRSEFCGAAASGQYGGPKVLALAPCPACAGTGDVSQPPCASCSGRGRRLASRYLAVRVPAGVERGQLLRVGGEGGAGRCGGPPGDLLVRLEVYPDDNLQRRGDNLHSSLAVDVFVAVLGGSVMVDTVRGRRLLDVPQGAQPGDVIRLSGAGVARSLPGGAGLVRGDHFFQISVTLPSGDDLCGPSLEKLQQLARIDSTLRRRRRQGSAGGGGGAGPGIPGGAGRWGAGPGPGTESESGG